MSRTLCGGSIAVTPHVFPAMNSSDREFGLGVFDRLRRSNAACWRTLAPLQYSAHANHLVPLSRTICAFVLLLFASTNAVLPPFRGGFNDMFALAFAGFALFTLIVSFTHWYLDFTFSQSFIIVDISAFFVLLTPGGISDAASVAMTLCLFAHILFSSIMRWGVRWGIAIAAFMNVLWVADLAVFELPLGRIGEPEILRWSLFATLGSLVVIWACCQMIKTVLPRFVGEAAGSGLPLTSSAVGYAMEVTCAEDAVLCWLDGDGSGCLASSADAIDDELPPRKLSFAAADAFKKTAPMVFDLSRDHAVLQEGGKLVASAASALPGYPLLIELQVKAGICFRIDSDEGPSLLILTGVPMLGWGHLRLSQAICKEVTQGLAWQTASANALDMALSRLRQTLACDLHDSVAHSLAGAKFLLVALASKVGADSDAGRDINAIKEALEAEYLHVRSLIEQLRQAASEEDGCNLVEDIDGICPNLASRWQIEVNLVDSDFRVSVPVWLSLEIQQIVREAVSNGVRHGNATKVSIKCQKRARAIQIEVTDNGEGFEDPTQPTLPRSISDRLEQLGGKLDITSGPGATRLRMSIPSRAEQGLTS